ncbi:MAG: sigma-54-dependent Fis family transcriptional regulator [Verrucomicrobia bacterium]|nr:sigma-54-dependent Fis family transcriptional regulator [Verrucomicrobiota bacterium]
MPKRCHVLVIDDDAQMLELMRKVLGDYGCRVSARASAVAALKLLDEDPADIVLSDVRMPGMDGMELLDRVKRLSPETIFILMTAFGSIDAAVAAVKRGAEDYITKPFRMDEMLVVLERSLEHRAMYRELESLRGEVGHRYSFGALIGKSKSMQAVFDMIRRVARVRSTVLITGRSGTGKELVAKAIHYNSARRDKPFVAVNCAAIPETLLESELFGHVKGAFTGAVEHKPGLFEAADGGTILLDEIGEIAPAMQAKLLRTLQDRQIRRVGGTRPVEVDVRLIASTNRDLDKHVRAGRFREDLFFRINVISIELPPLAEHPEDIPLLVQHFVEKYAGEHGCAVPRVAPEALKLLMGYDWPGNVRELENGIERAVALTGGGMIAPDDLPPTVTGARRDLLRDAAQAGMSLRELEDRYILDVLEQTRGNQVKAAEILGVDRKTLYRKLKANRPPAAL